MTENGLNGRAVLRSPFTEDMPRAFSYSFPQKEPQLFGPYAETIVTFAHYHNFTLALDTLKDYRTPEVSEQIKSGFYNLTLHGSAYSTSNSSSVQFSYPIEWVKCCVMVPLEDELPKFWYIVWPFSRYVWLTLLGAVIYVAVLIRIIEASTRKAQVRMSYDLLQSVAILFSPSNFDINLKNRSVRAVIFYTLLFGLGFILLTFYQSHITAYCMKPMFAPPIDNVADIQRAKLKILISINVFEELRTSGTINEYLTALEFQLERISWQEFFATYKSLNRSFGYVLPQDMWKFVEKQQQDLFRPYFHMSRVCLGGGFNAFPLQPDNAVEDALRLHILAVKQAGLWNFWEQRAFDIAVFTKNAQILHDTFDVLPLNLEFFKIGWIVLSVGFLLSFCAMLFECYYFKRSRTNLQIKLATSAAQIP